jgi:aerobic carbon-monoxide dehydrogenase small subunit
MSEHAIEVTVNGQRVTARVEARRTLADFLRTDAGLTGTHLGCEHGVCGACTVIVAEKGGDGLAVRSCLMLAVQVDGEDVTTIEGLAAADGTFSPVQQAMRDNHALQCGFCTPGVVCTMTALTADGAQPSEDDLVAAMSGHLCRCTGYQGIRRAIRQLTGGEAQPAGDHA